MNRILRRLTDHLIPICKVTDNQNILIMFTTHVKARQVWDELRRDMPIGVLFNIPGMKMDFPNGSRITFRAGDQSFDWVRGQEFQFMEFDSNLDTQTRQQYAPYLRKSK